MVKALRVHTTLSGDWIELLRVGQFYSVRINRRAAFFATEYYHGMSLGAAFKRYKTIATLVGA